MLTQFKNGFYKRERFTRSRFHHYVNVFSVLNRKLVFVLFMVCRQHLTKIYFLAKAFKKTYNVCNTVLLIALYFILKLFCFRFCRHLLLQFSNCQS